MPSSLLFLTLTGSSGFIGRTVLDLSVPHGISLEPIHRPPAVTQLADGSIQAPYTVPTGCTAVIHLAARAHRIGEHGSDALAAYRAANVTGTANLIESMVQSGVRRLVYVSSIKALSERSRGVPLQPQDTRQPEDPYGISKAEAEDVVAQAHAAGRIEAVIIRPVLVHGPGAKGNLARLLDAIQRGRPLPLGAVHNRRSLVGVENLANALLTAATAPMPRTRHAATYHVADEGVISTRRLVEVLAEGLGVAPRLLSIPRWLAVGGATLLGKRAMAKRLFDDLEVDDSDFRRDFAWKPSVGLEDGLRAMAEAFARARRAG